MKVGWYTHHLANSEKTPESASTGHLGLFSGEFAGGAEMSDWQYRQDAPEGVEIQLITADNFVHPAEMGFDRVIVTGTESFNDIQLNILATAKPVVFVHHLQTPRASLKNLIDSSHLFITHTPLHMFKELMWTNPKRTAQVLSHFDTSVISPAEKKLPFAVWAAREHPLKGKLKAQQWAAENRISLDIITNKPREYVLETLAEAEWFVHLPLAFESECRTVMEAVLSGCKVHTNKLVGITSVEDWHDADALRNMIDKAGNTFWQLLAS